MTLDTETSSARTADGGHGFRLQQVVAQARTRQASSGEGRVRLVTDTGAVRGQGSLDALMKQLDALAPLRAHDWLPAHVEQAQKWHDALLTSASRSDHASKEAATWFKNHLRDLYHLDRAEQAAAFIPERPVPVRHKKIPSSITQDGRLYELQFTPFRWDQDTPGMVTNRLATLAVEAMPDSWLRVIYVERRRSSTYDPVIYAGYGEAWYIKVAEWV